MFCPNCGSQIPDGEKLCASCGAAVGEESAGAMAAAGKPPMAENPYLKQDANQGIPASMNPYGMQAPYGNQAPYGGQAPYGNQNPYGDQSPYANQIPYGGQAQYVNPYPNQAPPQDQGYEPSQQPMQQGFGEPGEGPFQKQAKSFLSSADGAVGVAMKVGLLATIVWVVAMLWLPFQTVMGQPISNVSVANNSVLVVIITIALGFATVYDLLSHSGANVLFSGIIMILWTAKSMIETSNAGWGFAYGAYLSIGCAVLITLAGFLCWRKSRAGGAR